MSPIDKVPPEVLLYIFQEYVLGHLDSPQRLLRVSRLWYEVASTGSLWGDIVLCENPDAELETMYGFPGISQSAMRNKILCRSLSSLAKAIERTQGSKFELIITSGREYNPTNRHSDSDWDTIQPLWLSKRCRALRIYGWSSDHFPAIFSGLSALEELEILGTCLADARFVDGLLEVVVRTSKRLRCFHGPIPIQTGLPQLEPLLSRVTVLRVDDYWGIPLSPLAKAARSVKTLELRSSSGSKDLIPFECSSPFLDTLILYSVPCNLLSSDIAYKIRHLTTHQPLIAPGDFPPLEFPNLTHMTVIFDWHAILGIRAPRLEVLTLHGWIFPGTVHSEEPGLLRPTTLNCDISMSELQVRSWIQDICQNVRDLQFVYRGADRSLWRPLASWLKGKDGQDPPCPELQRLTILSVKSDMQRQKRSEKLLQGVANVLRSRGSLKEVKYGWYEGQYDEPKESHTRWTSLLEE